MSQTDPSGRRRRIVAARSRRRGGSSTNSCTQPISCRVRASRSTMGSMANNPSAPGSFRHSTSHRPPSLFLRSERTSWGTGHYARFCYKYRPRSCSSEDGIGSSGPRARCCSRSVKKSPDSTPRLNLVNGTSDAPSLNFAGATGPTNDGIHLLQHRRISSPSAVKERVL